MKKTTYLLVACMVALLAGGLYYFLREEAAPLPRQQQETGTEAAANPLLVGNSIVEEQNGRRIWELSAEKIEMGSETNLLTLTNIKGIFYKDDGGTIEVTAPGAFVDTKTRDVTMTGSVKAVSSDGATFTAAEAHWAGQERHFSGNGNVRITRDDTVITGDRMESDANLEKVRVEGNAHVVKGGASN